MGRAQMFQRKKFSCVNNSKFNENVNGNKVFIQSLSFHALFCNVTSVSKWKILLPLNTQRTTLESAPIALLAGGVSSARFTISIAFICSLQSKEKFTFRTGKLDKKKRAALLESLFHPCSCHCE
jgi:hypothetical protein